MREKAYDFGCTKARKAQLSRSIQVAHCEGFQQKFDSVYTVARKLLDSEDETFENTTKEVKVNETIQNLEQLTVTVSQLSLFSRNESLEELSPDTLKFMLLPYLLGSLWQIKKVESKVEPQAPQLDPRTLRKNICDVSQIYFKDFIQRCLDYNVISNEPSALNLLVQFHEIEARKEDPGSGDATFAKKQMDLISKHFDSGDRREQKVKTFKETKELEKQIKALEEKQNAGEELDEETIKTLYLNIIRRAVHDANSQLEAIIQELHLLNMSETRNRIAHEQASPAPKNPYGLPFKTFILTKTDLQKNVFGMGYPALPVMTVEELYEKRREEGTWPGPPTAGGTQQNQGPTEDPDDQDVDEDDPEYLARQRNMDEYKDTHRRGWGNRMNRS